MFFAFRQKTPIIWPPLRLYIIKSKNGVGEVERARGRGSGRARFGRAYRMRFQRARLKKFSNFFRSEKIQLPTCVGPQIGLLADLSKILQKFCILLLPVLTIFLQLAAKMQNLRFCTCQADMAKWPKISGS